MKASLCLVGVALMLCIALEPSSAQELAFVGVNVVPMDRNAILNNRTVIVRDGRIADVGAAGDTRVPAGAQRVEGRGKYLMPGLGEMHGHIPSPLEPREFIEAVLFLYVANGVTTVRGMQGAPGQLDFVRRPREANYWRRIFTSPDRRSAGRRSSLSKRQFKGSGNRRPKDGTC